MSLNLKSLATLSRALRIFCTCEAAIGKKLHQSTHLHHLNLYFCHGPARDECDADLFPVRGDNAYLARCNGSMAFLSTRLQQFSHIVHQHLHLCHIKERGAARLTLVNTSHTVKDQWKVLREGSQGNSWLSYQVVWLPQVSHWLFKCTSWGFFCWIANLNFKSFLSNIINILC